MSREFSYKNSIDVRIDYDVFNFLNHYLSYELFEDFCFPDLMPRTLQPVPLNNRLLKLEKTCLGAIAQLVEHLHGMQGVRSSSLLGST